MNNGTSMLFFQNLINKMDSDLKNFQFEIQNISNKELIKLLETDKDELSVNVIQEKNVQVKKVQKERIERTQKISILLLIIGII